MDPNLVDFIKWYLVFLFSTVCHEAAHAWTAHRLGDDTAYRGGQASLDPWPHIQRAPFGMVAVPLLSYFLGGWMIGWASAPYDANWAIRYPRRAGLMALAGPVANLILVLGAAVLMRIGFEWGVFHRPIHASFLQVVTGSPDSIWGFCAKMLSLLFALNVLLASFNLLPFPPLDGSNLPLLFLPSGAAEKYWLLIRQPMVAWIGLVIAWNLSGAFFPAIFRAASKLLYLTIPH
jgi:Zn-dependent protease